MLLKRLAQLGVFLFGQSVLFEPSLHRLGVDAVALVPAFGLDPDQQRVELVFEVGGNRGVLSRHTVSPFFLSLGWCAKLRPSQWT